MSKPRILICADVPNWCWASKSRALQQHLGGPEGEFVVDVAYINEDGAPTDGTYDLYHLFEFPQVMHLPPRWPKVTGITAHVWRTWEGLDKPERGGSPGTVARWASAEFNVRGVHANSRMLQAEMEALLSRPIAYLPNGVDEQFFRRTRPYPTGSRAFQLPAAAASWPFSLPGAIVEARDDLVVGWVGKPDPRKGADIVREACRLAGVELRTVERSSKNALSPEEMREFYQDIHVLAVASDKDGTPNPMLEAAACEVATVGNRIGNLPEFIAPGANGLLVERNAESLAEGLCACAADIGRTIAMGQIARGFVDIEWAWKHQAERYRAFWRECLR